MGDLGTFAMAFLMGLAVTYGFVESVLLLPLRIAICSAMPEGSMLEELIYCPLCTGFWMQGVVSVIVWADWIAGVRGALIGVGVMLVFRALGLELVRAQYSVEQKAINTLRKVP